MELIQYIIFISLASIFIAGSRQLIGLKDIGFINGIILAFLLFKIKNIFLWLILTFILFIFTYLIYSSFKNLRLLKMPKQAFSLILVGFFIIFLKLNLTNYPDLKINLDSVDLVLFTIVSSHFIHEFNILNFKKVSSKILQALVPIIFVFLILSSSKLMGVLEIYYYYFIPLFMIITLIIGRYSGLRLTEIKRFYNLFK